MISLQTKIAGVAALLAGALAWASPLSTRSRSLIPSDVRQIISIDYRMAVKFDTAMLLKAEVLPDNLKAFESALLTAGVRPDADLESLTFASFDDRGIRKNKKDDPKQDLAMLGVAEGSFSPMNIATEIGLKKIVPTRHDKFDFYPLTKTMTLVVLDDHTLLMGTENALLTALEVRDHRASNVDSNLQLTKSAKLVEKSTVWSVLDAKGTKRMLVAALGKVKVPNFDSLQEHVLGSRYSMNFKETLRFKMDLSTTDMVSAANLSSLLKLGVLYKKVTTNPAQKVAWDHLKVTVKKVVPDADPADLKMEFKVNQPDFRKLLKAHCFDTSDEHRELAGVTSAPEDADLVRAKMETAPKP
jgi:hypothetical protein